MSAMRSTQITDAPSSAACTHAARPDDPDPTTTMSHSYRFSSAEATRAAIVAVATPAVIPTKPLRVMFLSMTASRR